LLPVLAGYKPCESRLEALAAAAAPAPSASELAFSPLALPTIVTPYGVALLILLVTLHPLSAGASPFWE
jgi:small neutral amino acid transporter SnatA (MarC family)